MLEIVVCDDIDNAFLNSGELVRLESSARVVVHNQVASNREELLARLRSASVAVAIRDRTVLDRQILASLPQLRLIASTGPQRIDIRAAAELGIVVAGTPGTSTVSVAEHVFGMILALARRIPHSDHALRQRRWTPSAGLELEGKTLGILGLGRTGSAVAKRAPAFGLHVIAWGPTLTPERAAASGASMVGEEELFRKADILSVHLRRSEFSKGFVNSERLAWMKPTAFLIDISWEGIANHSSVAAALRGGKLGGAALDLCGTDPVSMDDPILDAPGTVLTPHLAWQTRDAYQRAAALVTDNILAYLKGSPTNVVNPDALDSPRQLNRAL
ncbi:MAG: NAD(P)-dependent oxidoreductase [Candidatus Binatia bacterium]